MKRNIFTFFTFTALIICNVVSVASEYSAWTKGETWRYQHDGPIPFLGDDSKVVGDRVIRVIDIQENDREQWWKLKENWGDAGNEPRTFTVDAERKAHHLLWGDDEISYEPAMPMDYCSLKIGEEQTDDIVMKFGEAGFKCTVAAKRMPDQDVTVPAGKYEKCVHVKIDMTMHFGEMKLPVDHQVWYHPDANFIVKEEYHFKAMKVGGLEWSSHTCRSELKEYVKPSK